MKKYLDYLFLNIFLAPDGVEGGGNENNTSQEDLDSDSKGNESLNVGSQLKKNEPEVKLDYSSFDLTMDEKFDPSNLTSKEFATKAKELGIPVDQAKALFEVFGSSIKQSNEEYEKSAKERCERVLKERWKDNFEVNNKAMTRGFLKLTENDEKFKSELKETGLLDNPLLAEIMSKVGFFFKEEGQVGGQASTFDKNDPYGIAKDFNL